jgi:hypothetical protein
MDNIIDTISFDASQFHEDTLKILQELNWLQFLLKFDGYDENITKEFSHTFDGERDIFGNLTLHLSNNVLAWVIGLSK